MYKWEGRDSRRTGRAGMGTKPTAFQDLLSPRSWATPYRLGAPSPLSPTVSGKAAAEFLTCPASKHDSTLALFRLEYSEAGSRAPSLFSGW